jgi:L-alanine-DL-glutamate epimerase-like enolase superfamily enzyme
MSTKIIAHNIYLIALSLSNPFPLAFGTLYDLPRVLLTLEVVINGKRIVGIGEASIDFPFSHYDSWDIYYALNSIDYNCINLEDRELILSGNKYDNIRTTLMEYPAAFCAFNMAIDDLYGKVNQISLSDLYGGTPRHGKILQSVATSSLKELITNCREIYSAGRYPKIKLGLDVYKDIEKIRKFSKEFPNKYFALDVNGGYGLREIGIFINKINILIDYKYLLFLEQPTLENLGIKGLVYSDKLLYGSAKKHKIAADESFVTHEDAQICNKNNIILNYKIQKLGGIFEAYNIESSLGSKQPSFVGGTFPTAIGRAYDQQAFSILKSTSLPSDGLQPSSEWFSGKKHLIKEVFELDKNGQPIATKKPGIGITPNWNNIKNFVISNPKEVYYKVRMGIKNSNIKINLNDNVTYSDLYSKLNSKEADWNLI